MGQKFLLGRLQAMTWPSASQRFLSPTALWQNTLAKEDGNSGLELVGDELGRHSRGRGAVDRTGPLSRGPRATEHWLDGTQQQPFFFLDTFAFLDFFVFFFGSAAASVAASVAAPSVDATMLPPMALAS